MDKSSNNKDKSFSHVLQKAGVLKNFSVAKVVSKKEIEDLKQLIRAVAKDETEYKKMLSEEMKSVTDMHDPKTPIPGIIYKDSMQTKVKTIQKTAKDYVERLKRTNMTKKELCYLLASIIKELGLTQDDFLKLKDGEDFDDDEDEYIDSDGADDDDHYDDRYDDGKDL